MQDQPPQLKNGIVDKRGIAPVLISCDSPTTLSGLSAKEATPGVDMLEIVNNAPCPNGNAHCNGSADETLPCFDCFEGQE